MKTNTFINIGISIVIAFSFLGCANQNRNYVTQYQTKTFSEPLNKKMVVNVGDSLFISGQYIENEAIVLGQSFEGLIPGSMGVPFPITINENIIYLTEIRQDGKYFCADLSQSTATFIGSVVRNGDCIGIRKNGNKYEWVVDNSNYNRGWETIWSRNVSEDELNLFQHKTISGYPFKVKQMTKITFDGYYRDLLTFTLEEYTFRNVNKKQFYFDREKGKSTIVGIKGNIFEVHDVDNIKMTYSWKKIQN